MTTTTIPEYVTSEYLGSLVLCQGTGSGAPGDRCAIQEVRAWLDLDASTDEIPECVCPVLGRLAIAINDTSEAERAAIVPLLPRLIGTRGDEETTLRRARRCADWAVREVVPHAFDSAAGALDAAHLDARAATLREHAERLRGLAPITDDDDAAAARYAAADAARYAAAAARYAAAADAAAPKASALLRALLDEIGGAS